MATRSPPGVGTEAVLANYNVELVDATLTVTKAAKLVVTAADKTKVYGAGEPAADRVDDRGAER